MADAERSAPIAPRSARPVMFLHGPLASGRMWRAYAADLDAAVASLAPDLTGYGETPARPDGAPFRLCDEFAGIDAAPATRVASLFRVEPTRFAGKPRAWRATSGPDSEVARASPIRPGWTCRR